MPTYEKSGLRIILPDGDSFRFQDCSGYKSLSGKNLSEMDFSWWDSTQNILWRLDVKDYSHLTPPERLPEYLLDNLAKKAIDSLLILSAVWAGSVKGQEIAAELPQSFQKFPDAPKKFKLVFVLKIQENSIKAVLKPLKNKLLQQLEGRLALFDLKNIVLVDHELAQKMGLPLSEV